MTDDEKAKACADAFRPLADAAGKLAPAKYTHCYIGKAKCGCVVEVAVDDPAYPEYSMGCVALYLRDGLTVERITVEEFRAGKGLGCKCAAG